MKQPYEYTISQVGGMFGVFKVYEDETIMGTSPFMTTLDEAIAYLRECIANEPDDTDE